MTVWFLQDFERLAAEIKAVEALAAEAPWLRLERWSHEDSYISALLVITAGGADYPVRLSYPDHFPATPAWVAPQDPNVQWSGHQFGAGGALCLEHRPDTWRPDITGADLLRSAYTLLSTENPLGNGVKGEVASGHMATPFNSAGPFPLLADAGLLARLRDGSAEDLEGVRWTAAGDTYPMIVSDRAGRAAGDRPPRIDLITPHVPLPVFVTAAPAPHETPQNRAELLAAADLPEEAATRLAAEDRALVIFGVPGEALAICALSQDLALKVRWVAYAGDVGVRSGAPAPRADKTVAVVGAGSVGSKLAETLARSGVGRFRLVDGDVLLPPNLERNALDWTAVGARKVNGLRQRLLSVAPGVEVTAEASSLDWQRSPRTSAAQIEAIAACDVIVDATGDAATALLLGAVAAQAEKPFVSVSVFEGGLGALIASCLPDRDAPYAQARANFDAWCVDQGFNFPAPPAGAYGGFGADGTPMVADDAAVTVAAGHAGRTILDILDDRPAPASQAWRLIGLSDAWVFEKLGSMITLNVGAPKPVDYAPLTPELLAFILAHIRELKDAYSAAR